MGKQNFNRVFKYMGYGNFNRNLGSEGSAVSSTTVTSNYDVGLRSYMVKVYNYMAMALVITAVAAFGVSTSEPLMSLIYTTPLRWVVSLAPLFIVMYLSSRIGSMSPDKAQIWFAVFSAVMGVSLSFIFMVYTGTSIIRVFFITSATYAALSLYGYTTKKDLTAMGTFLFMGLIGLVLASIVNIFFASPGLNFAVSVIGVIIFAGLTAYDTQRIKQQYYVFGSTPQVAIFSALTLYMDFINLFISLLRLTGDRK